SIFPAFPDNPYIDLFATMDPAKEVGGDFYDFFMIDDKQLALVIADVSGKGVPAALFMVIAKTLIKNQVAMGKSPAEALENVNNQLAEGNESCLFVTVWLAVLDLTTGEVIEANAGHENPALCRKDGTFEMVKLRHSPAVAMMEGMQYKERTFHLDPGDTLFVYTDGVPEATNKDMQMFGEERLEMALNKYKDLEMKDLLPAIRREVDEFVGDADQFDDITMLGFRLKEGDSK
ncbi:MAG: serine/threonine-protein phosphatase, partial [Mogibacterium sp.]|nr:serine/threonine-protein phosphatase [Mogibacterium sp.]